MTERLKSIFAGGPVPYLAVIGFAVTDFTYIVYTGFFGLFYAMSVGALTVAALTSRIRIIYKVLLWLFLAYIFVYNPLDLVGAFLLDHYLPDSGAMSDGLSLLAPALLKTLQFSGPFGTRLLNFCIASAATIALSAFSFWAFGLRTQAADAPSKP